MLPETKRQIGREVQIEVNTMVPLPVFARTGLALSALPCSGPDGVSIERRLQQHRHRTIQERRSQLHEQWDVCQ
jgi:hypothetical protein